MNYQSHLRKQQIPILRYKKLYFVSSGIIKLLFIMNVQFIRRKVLMCDDYTFRE